MIKIIQQSDIYLTEDELLKYRDEYKTAYMMYSGTPPGFEQFCRMKKQQVRRG